MITRSLYLEVLNSLLTCLDISNLSESSSLQQLSTLRAHSLALCAGISLDQQDQQEGGVACDESVVLQHVKLLHPHFSALRSDEGVADHTPGTASSLPSNAPCTTSSAPSNAPCTTSGAPSTAPCTTSGAPSNAPCTASSQTFEALVSVLGCCRDESLLECTLEAIAGWGRRETITESLVKRVRQESDPDLLVHVSTAQRHRCALLLYLNTFV